MTPIPTVIKMPASTAAGIFEAIGPTARRIKRSKSPAIIPDSLVLPPEFIFTTVLIVAPAPGIPPKRAPIEFPIPWPISSLFGSWIVLVILSATIEVKSESIAPKSARVIAVKIYFTTNEILRTINTLYCISGSPEGIADIGL